MRRNDSVPARIAGTSVGLLTAFVTLPLVGLALRADERFYPYLHGAARTQQPLTVITHPIEVTSLYIELGNFRPLGRILEHANYLVQYELSRVTGLPMHIVLGAVRMFSVALLGLTLVWFVRFLQRSGPAPQSGSSSLPVVVALVFPGLVTYTGNSSTLVVFSGLYFQSAVLILLVAAPFAAPSLYTSGRLRAPQLAAFIALGAVAAATNELLYLAAVAAGVIVVVQARRFELSPSQLVRSRAGIASVAASLGFLAVFVPSRIAIALTCRSPDTRDCYAASEVTLADWSPVLWLSRVFAGLPMYTWWTVRGRSELRSMVPVLFLVLVVAIILVWRWMRVRQDLAAVDRPRGSHHLPILIGIALVLGAALLSSLSGALQDGYDPYGSWRESSVAIAGWTLVLAGIADAIGVRLHWNRMVTIVVAAATSLALALSFSSNVIRQDRETASSRNPLSIRIAVEAASFERTDAGDRRRCDLLHEFDQDHPESQQALLRRAMNATTQHRHGIDFCTGDDGG